MVNPDFELRRGPGSILLAQPAFLPSVISSFYTQNKGARIPRAPPLDPPLQFIKETEGQKNRNTTSVLMVTNKHAQMLSYNFLARSSRVVVDF